MANKALINLLVIFFLSLSHFFIFTSHASRLGIMMEKPNHIIGIPQEDTLLDMKKEVVERMSMEEINDYPGSGANNRHLPRQRGCIDC